MVKDADRKARLAYAIKQAREIRGLTPPQLARKLGKGRGTINKWEDPDSTAAPSVLDLGALCEALGVDANLFAKLPPIPPNPVEEFLVDQTVAAGVESGRRRARRRVEGDGAQ